MNIHTKNIKIYHVVGIFSVLSLLYLNFQDHIHFPVYYIWQPKMSFVGINSTRFVIKTSTSESCSKDFYVNGWNSYWLMQDSLVGPSKSRVSEMMKRGAHMGLTVCRTWAFSDGDDPNALQLSPGVFNERVFKGLDYVIVQARRHGIRLILSLVNNLNAFGGKAQYVKWAEEAGIKSSSNDSFFSNDVIKSYYKSYVKAIVTRRNSLSGVKYSEEPAIFAWELINEPRCESSSSAPALEGWITEMAAFVKSLDHKHLLTVGLEGFYGFETTEKSTVNPGKWAASLGSDFIQNSAIENIDFASVHAYPHSWIPSSDLNAKVDYLSRWVDTHIRDGQDVLKKPVLFSEVGSPLRTKNEGPYDRDSLLKEVYDKIYESAKKKEAGAGVLIWQLLLEGMKQYGDQFSLVARENPSTYKLIVQQSCRLRNVSSRGKTKRKMHHVDECLVYISQR